MSTIIRNHRGENRETRSHQSTKQATRGGPPAGRGGVQRFSSQLSAPFGEKPAGFFSLGAFGAKSSAFCSRRLCGASHSAPVDAQARLLPGFASLFPVRGTPCWLVPGFGGGFIIMLATSTHTPHQASSCYLLATALATGDFAFRCGRSSLSLSFQPLQLQPQQPTTTRARGGH